MAEFEVFPIRNSTVGHWNSMRPQIDPDPVYQRISGIWSLERQQLLIDSLINRFDIPKIYFHQFSVPRADGDRKVRYALVDGKQRLEAVWSFLSDGFPLADDFKFLQEPDVNAGGLTFSQLSVEYPALVGLLQSTTLDVMAIRTDDLELIEEMFSRLNEAAPLNAPEKRNALGGPCRDAVKTLAGSHKFFTAKLPFRSERYRHLDLATKFLYWVDAELFPEDREASHIRDVKKSRLDKFFKDMKAAQDGEERVKKDAKRVKTILDKLAGIFSDADREMLSSIGMISVYFLLVQRRVKARQELPTREALRAFNRARMATRSRSESEWTDEQYDLFEFDRLAQSPNDASALSFRVDVLDDWLDAHPLT